MVKTPYIIIIILQLKTLNQMSLDVKMPSVNLALN